MMLALILSLLGVGGGLGALAYFVGPAAMLGFGRSIFGFLAKVPWQVYAVAALAGLLAFLTISRGHALDRAAERQAKLEQICQVVRDVAGRPRQDCRISELQIRAFGKSIRDLEDALADQNRRVLELSRKTAEQQAAAAVAKRQAAKRADQADDTAKRMEQSAKIAPAVPCGVSKALEEQWR